MKARALVALLPVVFMSTLAHAVPQAPQAGWDACKAKPLGAPCTEAYVWESGAAPGTMPAPGQGEWRRTTAPAACAVGTTLADGGTILFCAPASASASSAPTASAKPAAPSRPDASTEPTGTAPSASATPPASAPTTTATKPGEASRGCSASSSTGGASAGAMLVAIGVAALAFAARRRRALTGGAPLA